MAEAIRPLSQKKVKIKFKKKKDEEAILQTDEVLDSLETIHKNWQDAISEVETHSSSKEVSVQNIQKPSSDSADFLPGNEEEIHSDSKCLTVDSIETGCEQRIDNKENIKNCINDKENDLSVKPSFEKLNEDLNNFKPFLKPCQELEQLKISDQEAKVSECCSTAIPSAPQMNENDNISSQCYPSLLSKSPHSLVRQRCSEPILESPVVMADKAKEKTTSDIITIKPYSELQLMSLYNNILLEQKETIITDFLEHEKNIMQNKFYEILQNYLRARTNLLGTEKQIKAAKDQYKKQKEKIWTFEELTLTEESMCEDDQLLSVKVNHEIASYHPTIAKHISKQLKQIREVIFESHSLHMYTSEMSKLQVENYLQQVFISCPKFTSLPKYCPVSCHFSGHEKSFLQHVNHLKDCISILMLFSRRNVHDLTFLREIKSWLSDAVAILLRVATYEDHLFILNHLMRCSAGVGDWGSHFIQIVPPAVTSSQDIFSSSNLDHLMTVLAILLHPTRQREHFLRHFKGNAIDSESDQMEDASWIVIDSSGEDEEDATEMWHYYNENDIIQFLNQIPFEEMFKYVLLVETHGEDSVYDVNKATQHSIMKLFAFCTCLLKLFQEGLTTYHQARFKGVVKRLSRLIRHTVHYVTDHWLGFIDRCRKEGTVTSVEDNAMTIRLQVEYDEFFEKAVRAVFLSPRCGAWQFLAVVPYTCVSLSRLWKIAYKLHVGFEDSESTPDPEEEDWPLLLKSDDTKGRLHDRLATLGDSEAYYLLTALANMAIMRSEKEKAFIEAVVSNLFDTTLVNEDLRSSLNRTGRDLFLTITAAHPFTVSSLLSEVQEKLNAVGGLSLYLFRFLCLDGWHPAEEDLHCLSYWLLYTPASSLESQLARIIIAKMNWGFALPEDNKLALPRSVHERVALLVVEIALKLHSKGAQGGLLSEGVKQVTSVVYAPSHEQVFSKWCWSMLNQLHLHQMDQPDFDVQMVLANQSLILRGIGDPSTSPQLEPLKKGLASKHPLTMFAALLMSSWGHSIPEICNHVPECLETLASNGHSEAALTVLSLVTPLFFNQHEELVSDTKFVNALQCILSSDQTYVNLAKSYISSDAKGNVVRLFQGLITDQIFHFRRFNLENRSPIVKFWIDYLVLIPNWRNNISVLNLVDVLCESSLFDYASWQVLKEVFIEQRKIISGEKGSSKGGLGGLLSWVSSGSGGPPSLLVRSYATEVPWFALCVLICEAQEEISSGLWKGLLIRLHANSQTPLETALKEVCSDLQITPLPSSSLTLYRLGQQLLDLPCNHPAFPITAQVFLTFHLARTPPQTGQYDCSSVIYKFYEGFVNGNFLKKIKYKMGDVFTYWESEMAKEKNKETESSPDSDHQTKINFLSKLVTTLGAMSTWMEETKLYETGLYIPALPPQLLPKKLLVLFQENWDLWPELVDVNRLNQEMEKHVKRWKSHRHCSYLSSPPSSTHSSPSHICLSDAKEGRIQESATSSESILKRLKEYDPPKAPPPLPVVTPRRPRLASSPSNKDSVLYDIERFTTLLFEHSRIMFLRSKEICALDCVYTELLPQLWSNPVTKTVFSRKCKPKKNSKLTECSGPATIVAEYCEKRLNEGVNARIQQNREQHLTIFNQSTQVPPLQLCEAALHLEELVNNVVSWHKNAVMGKDEGMAVIHYGRDLFYHFVQLTSEETQAYPPAKQLINSCSDTLGQEFLHGHKDCQESLATQVLQSTPQFAVLLSPHFTPLVTPVEIYLSIYSSISPSVSTQPDLCFMLLSKFEMETWLCEKRIGCAERSQLIRCVCDSLSSTIALGNEATVTCLELYRVHLRALLSFNFPEHFAEVITLLLDLSIASTDCGNVRRNIWYDLLNTLAKGVAEFSPQLNDSEILDAVKRYAREQVLLTPHMVKDTIDLLSSHFIRQRVEFGLYGLYSKYRSDVTPVTTLLGMISCTYIITASMTSQQEDRDSLKREIWTNLIGLWAAWVSPLGGQARASCPKWVQELTHDKSVLLPWTPGDTSGPAHAVGMFASTLAFFHDVFEGSEVLSMFLDYYYQTYASPSVKDYILGVVHSKMAALPWHHLSPSLKDVELFSKIINEYLPECHSFVGSVFIQISWPKVVQNFMNRRNSRESISPTDNSPVNEINSVPLSTVVKLHILLMNILVRISMEPSVRQSGLLHPLLDSAISFHWQFVDAKNLETILNWFVMSCDPRIALQMNNRNPIDVSLIRLLHVAAGYSLETTPSLHRSGTLKRRLLVRALCRLLTTSATRHKALLNARKLLFGETYSCLMTHMEQVIVEGLPEAAQYEEGVCLSAEAVHLIGGGASPAPLQEVCRDSLLGWLKGCHSSRRFLLPLAASISKGVLHLHYRSPLLNECVTAILNHADAVGERERLSWMDVVRVLSFPVTNPMPMLTFAAQENHLFVIYVHTKWRLHLREAAPGEHLFVLATLIELLTLINPDEHCETSLLLVLGEAIDLIETELQKEEDYESVWRHTNALTDLLSSWGEDRSFSGILAAIGFGNKKSSLSPRTRLICKSLATSFRSQLLSPGYFCSLNEHKRTPSEFDDESDARSSDSSLKSLQHLLSLRSNAMYASYHGALTFAIEFIQDCHRSILDTRALFDGLLSRLFPRGSSILQLRRSISSEVPRSQEFQPEDLDATISFCGGGASERSSRPSAPPVDSE